MCHNLRLHKYRPGGEIGRLRGLKIPRRKACRFESGPGHHLWKPSSYAGFKRIKANLHGLAFFYLKTSQTVYYPSTLSQSLKNLSFNFTSFAAEVLAITDLHVLAFGAHG